MLRLPVPPSTNNLFLNAGARGRIKTPQYKAWVNAAGWELNASNTKPGGIRTVIGPAEVVILCPRNKRRDLDNHAKAILDLLVAHLILIDDRHVERLVLGWQDTDMKHVLVGVTAI